MTTKPTPAQLKVCKKCHRPEGDKVTFPYGRHICQACASKLARLKRKGITGAAADVILLDEPLRPSHTAARGVWQCQGPCGQLFGGIPPRRAWTKLVLCQDCAAEHFDRPAENEDPAVPPSFTAAQRETTPVIDQHIATPPEPTPLEEAYRVRREREERTKTKAQVDALIDENTKLKAEIEELSKMQAPVEILVYKKAREERSDATAVILGSDWHIEEEVDPALVHGLNEYNLDIARARAEKFAQNALRLTDIMARDTRITTMWLGLLGDFFSGWIHEELLAATLLAPGSAANYAKQLLYSCFDFWLKESTYILSGVGIPGNHGRLTKQMHFSDPVGTSLESVMYNFIADRYQGNPRVQFRVSPSAMVYERFYERFNMRAIHGYETKYSGGIGGLTIPLNKAITQWDKSIKADLTVLGHYHQFFDGGNFLVNGSLIGYNTYAEAIKATYEEPRQAFFLIHARKGGQKSIVAPIWLDDAHKLPTAALPVA